MGSCHHELEAEVHECALPGKAARVTLTVAFGWSPPEPRNLCDREIPTFDAALDSFRQIAATVDGRRVRLFMIESRLGEGTRVPGHARSCSWPIALSRDGLHALERHCGPVRAVLRGYDRWTPWFSEQVHIALAGSGHHRAGPSGVPQALAQSALRRHDPAHLQREMGQYFGHPWTLEKW
jgi:hypothetical protein